MANEDYDVELANSFRAHLRAVVMHRMAYFFTRIPTDDDLYKLRLEMSEDGNTIRYFHGSECLLHADMTNPSHVHILEWDKITLAEIEGSAPGPPNFGVADNSMLERVGEASDFIVQTPPERKGKG